jgi:hypothetical protein
MTWGQPTGRSNRRLCSFSQNEILLFRRFAERHVGLVDPVDRTVRRHLAADEVGEGGKKVSRPVVLRIRGYFGLKRDQSVEISTSCMG